MSSTVLFINDNAVDINEIFLNEDWQIKPLMKDIDNVFTIQAKDRELKWLIKTYESPRYARKESSTLTKLRDVNGVPKVLAIGISKKLNYTIISRVPGIDLHSYVTKYGPFTEDSIRPIVKQLLTILVQIHSRGVIHQDIKPENIVYDGETVSLIDFESKDTAEYRSLEQSLGKPVTDKTDLWSLGVTIYYLVADRFPYRDVRKMKGIHYVSKWSTQFTDFLEHLLELNVELRYNAKDALNHCWICK